MTVYKLKHLPTGKFYDRRGSHTENGAIYPTKRAVQASFQTFMTKHKLGYCSWDSFHGTYGKPLDEPSDYVLIRYRLVEDGVIDL